MRIIVSLFAALVMGSFNTDVKAGFFTGNELYNDCKTEKADSAYSIKATSCYRYIVGVEDAHTTLVTRGKLKSEYCVVSGVQASQLRDAVVGWLDRNPQYRHLSASSLVIGALIEAFPCGREK